jgi:exopolyphosphatase / guanosine-5'-triphosphate,3'-diphosphate pyrophosphatase
MNGEPHSTHAAVLRPDLEAVQGITERLDPEPEHALHVATLAAALFDAARPLHQLDDHARCQLEAAAMLHDIGFCKGASKHHKHSRSIIMKQVLPGFSDTDHAIIACVARYHRKAHPKPQHKLYRDLDEAAQARVRQLAALLRVADGLDRAHLSATRSLRLELRPRRVRIHALQDCISEPDIWGGMRKRFLFEQEFGVQVEIVPECDRQNGANAQGQHP